ncbi:MAG: hypothetical protein IE891_04825 [Flavobacteriaceae bacterium]|nr:hypothetical protein [Flavobacteriaceae bacterium]
MKKVLLTLVFIFSVNLVSKAQEPVKISDPKAKETTYKIKEYLSLDDAKTQAVYEVIAHKNIAFSTEPNLNEERKILLRRKFDSKIKSVLNENEYKKLKANKALCQEIEN